MRIIRHSDLPARAMLYLLAVAGGAAAATLIAGTRLDSGDPWATFALLAVGAAAAQLLVVPTGRNHGFHTAIVFVVAAALLLPPELVILVGLLQHVPEGVRKRYPWYILSFNVGNATLNALGAWAAALAVRTALPGIDDLRWALAGLAAAVALVAANHLLLALMLQLARGRSFRASGLFSPVSLGMDLVLAGLGIATAVLWRSNPWVVPAAIAPLVLSQRSFSILALLRASEARFRAMFDSAPLGTALLDLDGRVVATNPALERMLGYSADELKTLTSADLTHPDDLGAESSLFRDLVAGESAQNALEKRYVTSEGDIRAAHVALALVRDVTDKPEYAIAMVRDVTEQKELEEQLRQAQKMEAVGLLAGGVAHDFNNILTAITGYTEFALYGLDAGRDAPREELEEIRRAADRATSLTRQLLAFSRRQILQPRLLDVSEVVQGMEKMLRRLIGEDIEIRTSYADEPALVEADPSQLEQVVLNLVVNARDAITGGGKITIDVAGAGDHVILTVADTGCGMDEQTKARVFEPFFTTKPTGRGTGLGLSTVYGVVTQSGGSIDLESEVGAGTRYTITLPALERASTPSADGPGGESAQGGSETVLLAEDEEMVRKLLREVLKSHGYTVLEARDGAQALSIAERRQEPIDLLVTDVVMPNMTGFELAEQLRPLHAETRVLYMSGYIESGIVQDGLLDQQVDFLQKPFTPGGLAARVRAALDSAREVAA